MRAQRPSRKLEAVSMATGSTSWTPCRTWTSTCQNDAYTTSSSLERRSVPNSSTARGIRATEGMGRRNSMVEPVAARRAGTLPSSRPSPTPAATATARPIAHPSRVSPSAVQNDGRPSSSARAPAIRLVGGRYRSGTRPTRGATSSRTRKPPSPATPSHQRCQRPPSREQGVEIRLLGDQAVLDGQGGQRLHRGPVDLGRPLGQGQLLDDGLVDLGVAGQHLAGLVGVGVGAGQRLGHGLGEPLDQVRVVLDELLGGEVDGHGEVGRGVDVVGGDQAAVLGSEVDRNGSTTQMASTRPAWRAAGMSGKASSTNLIDEGSPPALRTEARMVVSPMFLRVLTATRLPARSAAVLIAGSLVTTPPKSALSSPVEATRWRPP